MDSHAIARTIADRLVGHRNRLAGKADDVYRALAALAATASVVGDHHAGHRSAATTATQHWNGEGAAAFDRKARKMTSALKTTAAAAGRGAEIVAATAASLDTNHRAVAGLVDEYYRAAVPLIDGARAAQAAGSRAAVLTAVSQVVDLVRDYTNESVKHVRTVQREMTDGAEELRKLAKDVEHDGVWDRPRRRGTGSGGRGAERDGGTGAGSGSGSDGRGGSALTERVLDRARSQLGYHEGPGNANKYGPTGYWCSNFTTWVWQKSGVDIGILPFTGDVYQWGRERDLAYSDLDKARPGDVLLFGTGPSSPSTSTHIGIVEKVEGNQVTLIEGNSADQVRRVTHPLSRSVFYGGVHPR